MSCLPSGKRGNNQHSLFPNGFCLWNVRAGMFGATIDGAEDKRADLLAAGRQPSQPSSWAEQCLSSTVYTYFCGNILTCKYFLRN